MRSLLAAALLACTTLSFGWIDTGHMIVAAIAQSDLKPLAKLEAERLLKIGGDDRTRDFLGAACWADDTKTPENGPWHYINYHFRSDGQPSSLVPEKENVLVAIERFAAILRDRRRPDPERADALRYLLHFVGDVHQPLHSVARDTAATPEGDRGGNEFKFDPPVDLAGFQVRSLHFLWDIAGGLYGGSERPLVSRAGIDAIAQRLRGELPRGYLPELAARSPESWAKESLALAQSLVYALPEGKAPGEKYLAACKFACERRLTLAGYRLADLLNQLIGG